MIDRRPAEVFPPGDFIREEMEERGWTQQDLAEILGKPLPTVNQILKGKKAIVVETAKRLGAAFGTSAQFWMNLETSFRLNAEPESPEVTGVRTRAKLYEAAPIREMEKRGWIKRKTNHAERDEELRRFYGIESLDRLPSITAAARASVRGEYASMTAAQWAWCVRAQQIARAVHAKPFRRARLDTLVAELHALTESPEEIRRVPGILAEAGIRLVIIEHLSKTKMDGAALGFGKMPVIAISLRFGRLDHFWFTLLHELAHIYNKDGVRVDVGLFEPGAVDCVDRIEERANNQAAAWLINPKRLESFILRTTPLYSTERIINFSRRMKVHPSIVAGQLKFRKELEQQQLVRLNTDVRDIVRSTATCDGWGEVAPV